MKIAFFSAKSYDIEYFNEANKKYRHEIDFFESRLREKTADLTHGYRAVCVFVNDRINEFTLKKMSKNGVELLALRCAGFNHVDMKAAKEFGIKVVRVPAYSPEAVAEHTLALILALNRKTHKSYNRVRDMNFSLERLIGFNLHGKTVGIIGTGKIGSAFARIMLGMGCEVKAYDKYPREELKKMGVEYTSLDELFCCSDIISLHCPLTDETHHMINKESLKEIGKGTMLINTSRGALINAGDVIDALKDGTLGYLGIDVYEQEDKLFFKDLSETVIQDDTLMRLLTFPNVIITAHQAFFTREALTEIAATTLQNTRDFEEGKDLENEVRYQS